MTSWGHRHLVCPVGKGPENTYMGEAIDSKKNAIVMGILEFLED